MKPTPQTTILTTAALVASLLTYALTGPATPAAALPQGLLEQPQTPVATAESASQTTGGPRRALEAGPYGAPVGRVFEYRHDSEFRMTLQQAVSPEPAVSRQSLSGTMTLRVLDRSAEELLVEVSFPGTAGRVSAGDTWSDLGPVAMELAGTFGVRLARDGRVLGYRFPEGLPATRRLVRTLVSALQFVVPSDAGAGWETREEDVLGRSAYRYEKLDEEAGLRELRRTRTALLSSEVGDARPEGRTVGTLDIGAGWMRAVELEEVLRTEDRELEYTLELVSRVSIELVDHRDERLPAGSWLERVVPEASVSGSEDVDEDSAPDLADVRMVDVLAELSGLAAAGGLDRHAARELHERIAELVRQRPAELQQLADFVLDPATDPLAAKVVLAGVASADTEAAQGLLAGLLRAEQPDEELRCSAATGVLAMRAPGIAVVRALEETWRDARSTPRLASTSLLMLGSSARGNAAARQRLEDLEQEALERGQLEDWLRAVGNAGHPQLADRVEPYLSHDDDSLRAAAVHALRNMQSARVGELLRRVLASEGRSWIRSEAAEWLGRQVDAESLAAVTWMVDAETTELRIALVHGLALNSDRSEVADLLQGLATGSDDPAVRHAATQVLSQG